MLPDLFYNIRIQTIDGDRMCPRPWLGECGSSPNQVTGVPVEMLLARPDRVVVVVVGEGVGLAGECCEGGGDVVEGGFDVGGGGGADAVGVAGVGPGDAVAEVAFHPGRGGVA